MKRRELLRLLATGTVFQLAPRQLMVVMGEARALLASQSSVRMLNVHQEATVKAMAEMILPRTDTPGATDVGATAFIDLVPVALACRFKHARAMSRIDEAADVRKLLHAGEGPILVSARISEEDVPRVLPIRDGHAIKQRFIAALNGA